MSKTDQVLAMHRFGWGSSPRDLALTGSNPREAVLEQITAVPIFMEDLPTAADHYLRMAKVKAARPHEQQERKQQARDHANQDIEQFFLRRVELVTMSETPFIERLVHFWTNHFAVSSRKNGMASAAAAFEFEAIRPNILGSFSQLLLSAESHPAMLLYLDNVKSIGPRSIMARSYPGGRKKRFGINENFAREILELHTMGVRSGYSQKDIIELSNALTGWSVGNIREPFISTNPGHFQFFDEMHEPGERILLGRLYPESGNEQAILMMQDLAVHPATARHIAGKLCRHFVADDPPPDLIRHVAGAFLASDGHLGHTYTAMLEHDLAWQTPLAKWKSPEQFILSSMRSLEVWDINARDLVKTMTTLGQPPYRVPSPAGWPDENAGFSGSAETLRRIEFAHRIAGSLNYYRPAELYQQAFGPLANPDSAKEISGAESVRQGISLFLLSPEFQRR